MSLARELWKRIEPLHAVTYFADESREAATAAGLRGFWMGYFGFRAAPLGSVGAGVVETAFANFAPSMVRRSIPDAWEFADPADLVRVRAAASSAVLRRLIPYVDRLASDVNVALSTIIEQGSPIGRPLFAANRNVRPVDDPVARLWQHCTTLREHRGDGHVIALAAAGVDGCEAHRLLIAEHGLPAELFRESRGWSTTEWGDAAERLRTRGFLDGDELSPAGKRLRIDVEAVTDALAVEPMTRALDEATTKWLIDTLTPAAQAVASSGTIPFPNPMGLPPLD